MSGADSTGAITAPAAARSRRPGWRNPRLLLGLALVAGSVVVGARVVASADDTVPVWAATATLPAGAVVQPDDVERRDVRFPDDDTAAAYVSAGQELPEGTRVEREVAAGDLLPRSAMASGAVEPLVEVPLSVAADDLPRTVRQGSVVDVWVAAGPEGADGEPAVRVLEEVEVVEVPGGDADGLAPQQTRQVILGLPDDRTDELGEALGRLADGRVVVARTG